MKLSRKDFRKFAEMTADIIYVIEGSEGENYVRDSRLIDEITSIIATVLYKTNPLFDRQRFDDHVIDTLHRLRDEASK